MFSNQRSVILISMVQLACCNFLDIEYDKDPNHNVRFSLYDKNVFNHTSKHNLTNICEHLQSQKMEMISTWKAPVHGWFSIKDIYHEFLVYQTKGPSDVTSYWSIEKNMEGFDMQLSSRISDVVQYVNYKTRAFSWKPQLISEFKFSYPTASARLLHFL